LKLTLDIGIVKYYMGYIFIYKNLNITFKLTCSWQYKNATAGCITEREKNWFSLELF